MSSMAAEHLIPEVLSHNRYETEVAVVVVPVLTQGHLNQLLHLSRIISSYHIPVHFAGTPTHNRQVKLRAHGWDPRACSYLHFHDLVIPSFDVLPPAPDAPSKFPSQLSSLFSSLIHLREPIYALVRELVKTSKRVVVVVDYFMLGVIQDFSSIPNVESYCFHSVSAFSMYYVDRTIAGKPVLAHGQPLKDLPPEDCVFPDYMWDYFREAYYNSRRCNRGILHNTSRVVEGQFLNILAEEKLTDTDNHWAIGPFNLLSAPAEGRKTCSKYLDWLDKQHPKSVIFISFGTITSLPDEQIKEIALGLERSGQSFVWVLREADRADIFVGESRRFELPEGFEERNEGRGIIIREWAPQLEILGHPATGGFMSHCGWNSCIESISMGVPIAAWPMHSEQPLNALLIAQVLKIGVMVVKEWELEPKIVRSETIEEAVKILMASPEGAEMRQRVTELSTKIKQSVQEDGSTTAEISSFIAHITPKI